MDFSNLLGKTTKSYFLFPPQKQRKETTAYLVNFSEHVLFLIIIKEKEVEEYDPIKTFSEVLESSAGSDNIFQSIKGELMRQNFVLKTFMSSDYVLNKHKKFILVKMYNKY